MQIHPKINQIHHCPRQQRSLDRPNMDRKPNKKKTHQPFHRILKTPQQKNNIRSPKIHPILHPRPNTTRISSNPSRSLDLPKCSTLILPFRHRIRQTYRSPINPTIIIPLHPHLKTTRCSPTRFQKIIRIYTI